MHLRRSAPDSCRCSGIRPNHRPRAVARIRQNRPCCISFGANRAEHLDRPVTLQRNTRIGDCRRNDDHCAPPRTAVLVAVLASVRHREFDSSSRDDWDTGWTFLFLSVSPDQDACHLHRFLALIAPSVARPVLYDDVVLLQDGYPCRRRARARPRRRGRCHSRPCRSCAFRGSSISNLLASSGMCSMNSAPAAAGSKLGLIITEFGGNVTNMNCVSPGPGTYPVPAEIASP